MSAEFDVLVVGGGPRALQALVELDDALARSQRARPLHVLVLDRARPGAGAVWQADQPGHLLMNLDPSSVDFSSTQGLVDMTYREWESAAGHAPLGHPPRARMGGYLAWVFARLQSSPRLRLVHRAAAAERVEPVRGGWEVRVDGAAPAALRAAEVLLCTGHRGGIGIDHSALVDERLGGQAGTPVTVRGAGLTGMDVVLSLTAGRGSAWGPSPDSPSGLRWVPSGREPSSITLLGRSGELMTPQPEFRDVQVEAAVADTVRAWRFGQVPDDAWWDVLVGAAVAGAATHGLVLDPGAAQEALDRGRGVPLGWQERWCADLCRAAGITDEDPAWWLGRAWAVGHPAMARSLERGPRDGVLWQRWRGRAARLDRWAFGPPVVTVRRLLALGEAGVMQVSTSAGPRAGARIDAVGAPAGILPLEVDAAGAPEPLWAGLLRAGLVSVREHERGVLTRPDGRCIGADGAPVRGLSSLGRPTEDPVIGHDTIARTRHGDAPRWAARVVDEWVGAGRPGAEEVR